MFFSFFFSRSFSFPIQICILWVFFSFSILGFHLFTTFFPFSQHFFIVTIIINFSFCFCFVTGYYGRLIYLTILKKEGRAIYLRLFICFLISSPSSWLDCLTDFIIIIIIRFDPSFKLKLVEREGNKEMESTKEGISNSRIYRS